jgi:diaminohydroxyphosphoribosylaminopyrimidine deaminase / 5-amino-6-(5-phosphoribosylamino)uracil reductase
MRRAFALAALGPRVNENPQVGCVLVSSSGEVAAEGFHAGAGSPHAEVKALEALRQAGRSAEGLTAVVSLEPCRHIGRTGPCVEALRDAGVSRVVYSVADPGGDSGAGGAFLAKQGVEVVGGVLAEEGTELIRHWYDSTRLHRPFVTIKWAQSLDGRIAAADGSSQWITSPATREQVHIDRASHGAILVGTQTALTDDPLLTARQPVGGLYGSQPHAVVMGMRALPVSARLHSHPGGFSQFFTHDPAEVLSTLYSRGIRSVYVEGGGTVIAAFVRAGLVDEYHITQGALLLGGPHLAVTEIGVASLKEARRLDIVSVDTTDTDIRIVARPQSTAPGDRGEK